ncbi:MAG: hypothetical protein B6I26_07030 [Desulfobacteraceae bacterium 4572_130]|nr:MAG: hypothetical protein B6I26_07030 [Desulfobacteraceae bacterium 4572_130]
MNKINQQKNRIIVVSNRLPISLKKNKDGKIEIKRGAGGLITAMVPILKNKNGIWIGCLGDAEKKDINDNLLVKIKSIQLGYSIKSVMLDQEDFENYYEGFSNSILWPLFHDFIDKCNFSLEYWRGYQKINKNFALTVYNKSKPLDFIWVHDYQLILVGSELRKMKSINSIGFFLHIPFPSIDIFMQCPWYLEIIFALLEYDLLGFHTIEYKRNFIECINSLHTKIDIKKEFDKNISQFKINNRIVKIGVFPISIDYNEFSIPAQNIKACKINDKFPGTKKILGVDRLDYTKGIPEKLKIFKKFLTLFPDLHEKIHFVQVVVPSRNKIQDYAKIKFEIENLVKEINNMFRKGNWVPVQYIFQNLDRDELIPLYKTCDILIITSLKDGMNLVAKEYCACNVDEQGVLILSEFTGVVHQFYKDVILINPYNIKDAAIKIHNAFNMTIEEKKQRMQNLQENVKEQDVFWWADSFLNAFFDKDKI